MSEPLSPEAAIALVPRWRGAGRVRHSPLPGGRSNQSWLIEADGEQAVLRLGGGRVRAPIVDRERELSALAIAAEQGLAPAPLYGDPARGILVTRYVAGEVLDDAAVRRPAALAEIARLLHRVHTLPLCGGTCGLATAGEHYLRGMGVEEDAQRAGLAHAALDRIRDAERGSPVTPRLCHRDPVAGNLIRCDGRLLLIDWEFAADGDPAFDLAAVVGYHDLSSAEVAMLLDAYREAGGDVEATRLATMTRAYDALHWLWLAAGQDADGSELSALEARLDL